MTDFRMTLAMAATLTMVSLPMGAQTRNWLAPVPDVNEAKAEVLTLRDTSINYGPRARVRIYRPDGVYEVDSSPADAPPATEGDRGAAAGRR